MLWHVQRIKGLVRNHLGRSRPCLVSAREAICEEPGCEGIATEVRIVLLDFRDIRVRIHKSIADVSETDIALVL